MISNRWSNPSDNFHSTLRIWWECDRKLIVALTWNSASKNYNYKIMYVRLSTRFSEHWTLNSKLNACMHVFTHTKFTQSDIECSKKKITHNMCQTMYGCERLCILSWLPILFVRNSRTAPHRTAPRRTLHLWFDNVRPRLPQMRACLYIMLISILHTSFSIFGLDLFSICCSLLLSLCSCSCCCTGSLPDVMIFA